MFCNHTQHRTAKIVAEIYHQRQHLDEEMLSKIRTPVGIEIGDEGPEEIAVSILAEIIADRNSRSGGPSHGRERAMHQKIPRYTASRGSSNENSLVAEKAMTTSPKMASGKGVHLPNIFLPDKASVAQRPN